MESCFRRSQHSSRVHNSSEDVKVTVHGDDFVFFSDDDGLKHIDNLLKSKHTGIRRSRREKPSVVEPCVFRVGVDQTGQHLDTEPDLRHAPLIISESGCNTNTKAVSKPREKLERAGF